MNNYRTIQQKDMQKLFPAWEHNIPTLGTKLSQPGNKTGRNFVHDELTALVSRAYGSCLASFMRPFRSKRAKLERRLVVTLLLMLMLGVNAAWGQDSPIGTDYSGIYYIANANYSDDTKLTGSTYSSSNKTVNFYLCPASNYYDGDINNDLKKMPFLTTHQPDNVGTDRPSILTDPIAKWEIVFAEPDEETQKDYYYIKFVSSESTKYYLVHNEQIVSGTGTNVGRVRYHLQLSIDDVDKDDYLFYISPNTRTADKNYNICSKAEESRSPSANGRPNGASLNPAKANLNYYSGQNQSTPGYFQRNVDKAKVYCGGLIGHWDLNDRTGLWYFEEVKCKTPEITYSSETGEVTITSTEGATIYYTIDGTTTPDPANAGGENTTQVYDSTDKPTISSPTTFKAMAVKQWMDNSEVATQSIEKLVSPTVTFVDATQKVTITTNSEVEGATSVYTTDGNDPIPSSTEYSEPISITEATTTVKAMTMKDGYLNSDVVSLTVTKLASSPSISKEGNTVTLSYTGDGTETIYYTTDGTTPTQGSSSYNAPFSLDGDQKFTIKAIATKTGFLNSDVAEQVVDNRSTISAPTITYTGNTVTITASDYGDEIYYTTDGSTPTTSTETHFTSSGTFNLDNGYIFTIKAIASYGDIESSEATETIDLTNTGYAGIYYIQNNGNGGEFYMYPVGGTSALVKTAKKTDQNAIWKIERVGNYYRIIHYNDRKYLVAAEVVDGSMPDTETVTLVQTDSPGENALFEITRKSGDESDIMQQILLIRPKAAANADGHIYLNTRGGNNGKNVIGLYDNTGASEWKLATVPAKPTFTVNDINVTISSDLNNVYYTIDGTTPTSFSTQGKNVTLKYGPNYTVKAICIYHDNISGTDWTSGVATSNPIQVDLLNPIITRSGNNVTITNSQASGVTFRYTFSDDGTDPADPVPGGEGTDYTTALSLTANARNVFKAIAYNVVDETTYTSDVITFVVNLRDAVVISSLGDIDSATGSYKLGTGFSATGTPKEGDIEIGTSTNPFKGTIDGNLVEFELGSSPLFDYVQDATIKNVIISKANISTNGNAGAIANNALGATRIYNCGVLATGSTVEKDKDGYDHITSCSSSISGSGYVGGIVGLLDGSSRVINCFSYANIIKGNEVGGIVGHNNVVTTSANLKTMVMNCMFYGDIDYDATDSRAPIYNGEIITNRSDASGVSNFNYFWAGASYVQKQKITSGKYNCALAAETRYLQRFEFFRHLLNSNRELAAWWATGDRSNKDEMMKWVMEPSQINTTTPYPILKNFNKYSSVVNFDAYNAPTATERNKGGKLTSIGTNGELSVTISGATMKTGVSSTFNLVITDKDPDHFNFNYGKVQLPYYNDYCTGNYTGNQVVTGWEVTVSGGSHAFTTGSDATASVNDGDITLTTPYNYADRKSTEKDNYSTNGKRIYNQGAYFDVPEGVTSITIKPHWAKCVFVADEYMDVVYNQDMSASTKVTTVGGGTGKRYETGKINIGGTDYTVYTTMGGNNGAVSKLNPSGSVYDNAIVLVGNVHNIGITSTDVRKPFTIMSIDLDEDNEPDYSYILRFNSRISVHPVRIDFLNVIGLGMAQKSTGGTGTYNFGIMNPLDWFEVTNTALFRVTQFEYEHADRTASPIILHGGVIEQWVSAQNKGNGNKTNYIHVGGNVWFKEFHIGWHQDNPNSTKHPPVSVTGGDFDNFYLTGFYASTAANYEDNAECYINGGRFGKVSGTGMEGIGKSGGADDTGNIIWQIDNADIDEFYAGGINAAHIAEGNIYTVISNSRVDQFCGGPKFGDMNSTKKVVTNATNCIFRTFFGAGYGGNSYNRYYPRNKISIINMTNPTWDGWLQNGNTDNPKFDGYKNAYIATRKGVEARIDYQFLPMSDNETNVARLFVDYVSFSKATTYDVTTKLTGCTITKNELGRLDISVNDNRLGNFYGGGSLGMVAGPVKSTLTNCTVEGNVYGAGYSATLPTVKVMKNSFKKQPEYDPNLGAYLEAELPETDFEYRWEHRDVVNSTETAIDKGEHILYTQENLTGLGAVTGNVTLTIDGYTTLTNGKVMSVAHSVYGGGEESNVAGNTEVNITGGTITQNVFGGGKGEADEFSCSKAMVGVNNAGAGADLTTEENKNKGTKVTISNGTVNGNVYGGGEVGRVEWNTQVTIGAGEGTPIINGSVFGAGAGVATHGYAALVRGNSTVTIQGKAKVLQNVYGGGEQATVGRYWVKGINNVDSEGNPIPSAPSAPTDMPDEMPYKTMSGGQCNVIVQGSAQVGPDGEVTPTAGHVFGAGKGVTPAYVHEGDKSKWSKRMVDYNSTKHTGEPGTTWDYYEDNHAYVWEYFATEDKYFEFLQTLALVTGTDVTIGGGTVKGNVYGGSESGFVQDNTDVKVTSGSIGTEGTTMYGNVFGGGKGLEEFAEAGKVKGTTTVAINNGTVNGNVYGGGELGDVGIIDKTNKNDKGELTYNYFWKQTDGNTANTAGNNGITGTNPNTGICTVTISGGTIGIDNPSDKTKHGNVFGAGRGSSETWWCEKAIVYATNVIVSAGTVKGNVYGGGEVGRVEDDAKVTIGEGDNAPTITGNVFGAGAGLMTHGYSALVRGNSDVTVQGAAQVGGSVYGGGETASVGRFTVVGGLPKHPDSGGTCKVTIQGNANIGTSGTGHNVFGACKGVTPAFVASGENRSKSMQLLANAPSDASLWSHYNNDENSPFIWRYYPDEAAYLDFLKTLALTSHPYVTISGSASVYGSVYGGGERGVTLGHVNVDITGGTVAQDVYGGGALADTNLGNWDENSWVHESKSAWYTTHVSLTGGTISGDAYGGGLGQKEFGTKGQAGYEPEIEAMVYGDVLVELNGKTTTENSTTTTTSVADDAKGCIVNRVFGCNNLNGTPKGKVQVYVYATQKSEGSSVSDKTKGSYDVQAVYGGGNLAKYEPVDATLIYNETNKATVDAARTEVYIDGCSVTSIKQVYGGGNAAPAPATYVEVRRAYEIDEVFGGGNGYDNYSLKEGNATVWYQNPGANVGYYTYAAYPKAGQGSGTQAEPYIAVETEKFSGGAEHKENRLSITDPDAIALRYGSGIATLVVKGGTIHTSYGGSNSKGNVRTQLSSTYSAMFDDCEMKVGTSYGGGKNAYSDADAEVSADCAKGVEEMFGGSRDADFDGNISLTITNGSSLKRVFGGNNTSGAVNGSITVTIEEGGCEPIRIEELYLGGFLAPYSVYGYEKNEDGSYKTESVKYLDENNVEQTKLQRIPLENGTRLYNDPRINVISATYIGNIFGGGYQAKLVGNPHINVNMENGKISEDYRSSYSGTPAIDESGNLPIGSIGNIYGGGNLADIVGDTYVEIGTGTWVTSWDNDGKAVYETIAPARNAATITGNVFGGGKGKADTFKCEKAMIGVENQDFGSTNVIIGNGTVGSLDENGKLVEGTGNVYGGGQIGRVELNTNVTIGLESGTSEPIIRGNVFGAGKGDNIHGYAALVRGNSTVTIQNNAKVGLSVYGGGEIASVGKYNLVNGFPVSLVSDQRGICSVTVKDNVEIGPDDMKMYHEGVDAADDKPDDAGHVFGGGKGILPYVDMDSRGPGRIGPDGNWEDYTNDETKYFNFIKTLALVTQTTVNIEGNAFIKGSVYGGSENGLIQHDTHVFIKGGQIGNGDGINRRYTAEEWAYDGSLDAKSLKECAHWEYKEPYSSYDPFANATAPLDKYSSGESTEGGRKIASDGHTYYGNVFGGGSGSIPYLKDGISKYNSSAGTVEGDTYVEISGGHILTNVYGGCEATNVLGTANVTMTGGSIGVPRTPQQIKNHPVTCYLFGAGKGDQRIFFNKETNVNDAIVKVEGGTIYGSVFGGGEDGHVLRNTTVTIGKTDGTGPKIGTVGSTYVDGNVFGGGRGFGGEALTAGNVGGAVDLIINGGEMLGSIYGGGRLASVGYGLYLVDEEVGGVKPYGQMRADDQYDGSYPNPSTEAASDFYNKGRGHITVTINGGTIGKEFADDTEGEHSGNVFGGSMGRLTKLDGSPFDAANHWSLLATAKSTKVYINGGTIKRSVYGGGEMGTITTNATVNVSGGTIGTTGKGGAEFGNVYGGGKGYVDPNGSNYVAAGIIKGNTTVAVSGTPQILHNVYGGGAYGSVGTFTYDGTTGFPNGLTENTGTASVTVTGGTIGSTGKDNGMVFGSSRGLEGNPETDANVDKIAWVGNTIVTIGTQNSETGPSIKGSVYGGGENGHNFQNASVTVHSGTIGIPSGEKVTIGDIEYEGARFPNRGNVYGSGCGTDTYTGTDSKTYFDFNAGIVRGNTTVLIDGGHVVHNVYGGGAMGSVGTYTFDANGKPTSCADETGTCTVTVSGGKIGVTGARMAGYGKGGPDDFGHVFGAGRGEMHDPNLYPNVETCAYFNKTILTISGTAFLTGSAYGGSESGHVLGDTEVTIAGGQIGCGKDSSEPFNNAVWADDYTPTEDLECASWPFVAPFAPYDTYANATGNLDQYSNGTSTEGGRLEASDGHTYYGNVFGGGSGSVPYFDTTAGISKYLSTAGTVEGNTKVTISGGHILTNVYGGCEATNVKGSATIKMTGGTVGVPRTDAQIIAHPLTGYVFGAGKGDQRIFFNKETNVNHSIVTVEGGRIYGSVYGGGEDGHVLGNVTMTIGKTGNTGPTIGTRGTSYYDGHVFGGGRGFGGEALTAGNVGGAVTLDILGGQILGSVYGGGRLASVGYGLYLVDEEVGGVKPYGQMRDDDQYDGSYPDPSPEAASTFYDKGRGKIYLTVSGGTIGNNVVNDKYGGNVYGGSMGRSTKLDGSPLDANHWTLLATVKQTTLTITNGIVKRNVYGGGELGAVKGAVLVNINGGTIEKDVYGGGALANTNTWAEGNSSSYTTTVNLLDGLVKGDAYGGGLGQKKEFNGAISDIEATVYGDITLNLGDENATKATKFNINYENTGEKDEANNPIMVVQSGRVFGCNNLNGSPQGNVTVHVYKTVEDNVERTAAENPTAPAEEQRASRDANVPHTYELAAVYGGGNLANYSATGKKAKVIIHTCDVSVQYVYGGGNAAAVPETDVLVKGAWEIDHVFGGGNGKDMYKNGNEWKLNAGADVTGNTNTLLIGGYIHEAYGGSNEKGTIGGNVTINTNSEHEDCACALELTKLYGAGKNADIEGDLIVVLECAPETKTAEIYGGAENANVKGNVELTITSGTFGKVFGGNNQSGAIFGHIILNIEETGCRPINIDELYGCGNNAAYSVYGYKNGGTDYEGYPIYVPRTSTEDGDAVTFDELPHTDPGSKGYDNPEVNIISCTSIGKVFGGGWGSGATVYGNPTVNINQIKGDWAGKTIGTGESAITIPNQLGEIGCGYTNENSVHVEGGVFGGGNEANVVGNTNVNVGTEAEVYVVKFVNVGDSVKDYYTRNNDGTYTATAATETAKADTYYYKKETVLGANITGNVYGGGNEAEVTGNTNVNIGKKSE